MICKTFCCIKILFLKRKQINYRLHFILAKVEKGEVIPDNMVPKSYLPLFVETTIRPSLQTWVPDCQGGKNLASRLVCHLLLGKPISILTGRKLPKKLNYNQTKVIYRNSTKLNKGRKFNPRILLKKQPLRRLKIK